MIEFLDGPAKDQAKGLLLARAPFFLRVVRGPLARSGAAEFEWDALDQLSDRMRERETAFAYRLVEDRGTFHILCARGKGSGWYCSAVYKFIEPQPGQAIMRDNSRWRAWCVAAAAELERREAAAAKRGAIP